jgi:hypothetical protein
MAGRSWARAVGAIALIVALPAAYAQTAGPPASKPPSTLTDQELKSLLIWNSPWEGRASNSSETISYRTTFAIRRDELIATVIRYSNSERGDSVVTIKEGRVNWQDTVGAEVSVTIEGAGDLVGTATSRTTNYAVVFKPRR